MKQEKGKNFDFLWDFFFFAEISEIFVEMVDKSM